MRIRRSSSFLRPLPSPLKAPRPGRRAPFHHILVCLFLLFSLPGCMAGYLVKQGHAQLKVLAHRQPLEKALPTLPPADQDRIRIIVEAKAFGEKRLELPVKGVYETWSGVNPTPIWNVSACPKDRLEPYLWKYPVLGKLPYTGFYDKADADRELARLKALHYDTHTYGAGAFSSLGFFSDPIIPSMLRYQPLSLVNLALHESAHRFLYFRGAADYNESFAGFVGDWGAYQFYLEKEGADAPLAREAYGERKDAATFGVFVEQVVRRIHAFYSRSDLSSAQKIAQREALFAEAQAEYTRLPLLTHTYDAFRSRPLDNATLLYYRRYGSGQALFDSLLERCDGDLKAAMQVAGSFRPRQHGRKAPPPFQQLKTWLETSSPCPGAQPRS